MVITYYGNEYFKIQQGDLTLALNPPSRKAEPKAPQFGADVGLITMHHPLFDGVDTISYGGTAPFIIDGPGEYEAKSIFVKGFLNETTYEGKKKVNTLYYAVVEGIKLCFAGALSTPVLDPATREELYDVDILFVPVGGGEVLDAAAAQKLARGLEAKLIIPMHYDAPALKDFLKQAGAEGVAPLDKLTIKKKDLEGKEGEVVVLAIA